MIEFDYNSRTDGSLEHLEQQQHWPVFSGAFGNWDTDEYSTQVIHLLPDFVRVVVTRMAIIHNCYEFGLAFGENRNSYSFHIDHYVNSLEPLQNQQEGIQLKLWMGGAVGATPMWYTLKPHVDHLGAALSMGRTNLACGDLCLEEGVIPLSETNGVAWLVYGVPGKYIQAIRIRLHPYNGVIQP